MSKVRITSHNGRTGKDGVYSKIIKAKDQSKIDNIHTSKIWKKLLYRLLPARKKP